LKPEGFLDPLPKFENHGTRIGESVDDIIGSIDADSSPVALGSELDAFYKTFWPFPEARPG
jgi:hypothetical protein